MADIQSVSEQIAASIQNQEAVRQAATATAAAIAAEKAGQAPAGTGSQTAQAGR